MLKGSNQILNDEGRRRQSDGWRVKLWGIAVGMNKKEPKFHDMERSFYSAEELQSDHTSNHVTHGVDTTWKRFRAKRYKRRTLHSAAKSPINSGLLQFQYVKVERRLWVRSRKSPELQLPAVHILSVSQRLAFFYQKSAGLVADKDPHSPSVYDTGDMTDSSCWKNPGMSWF